MMETACSILVLYLLISSYLAACVAISKYALYSWLTVSNLSSPLSGCDTSLLPTLIALNLFECCHHDTWVEFGSKGSFQRCISIETNPQRPYATHRHCVRCLRLLRSAMSAALYGSWIEKRCGSRATRNLYSVGKIYIASAYLYCRGLCACFLGQAWR